MQTHWAGLYSLYSVRIPMKARSGREELPIRVRTGTSALLLLSQLCLGQVAVTLSPIPQAVTSGIVSKRVGKLVTVWMVTVQDNAEVAVLVSPARCIGISRNWSL
jgi:hypothetical protein